MTDYGKRLRHTRIMRNLTQEQLAEKVGVDPKTIGHYERGTRMPKMDRMLKICNVLSVSLDYLFVDSLPDGLYKPNNNKLDELLPFLSELENEILLDFAETLYTNRGKYDK